MIVLVDASACLAQAADPLLADTLQRQLRAADLLVLNKSDLVDTSERRLVLAWLDSLAGRHRASRRSAARCRWRSSSSAALSAPGGRPPPGPRPDPVGHDHDPDHSHGQAHDLDHGQLFDTWSARPTAPFAAAVLRKLLHDMPAGVLRLKGVVRTDEHGWAELQFAGRHGSLRKAPAAPAAGAAVVAIGMRGHLPVQALQLALGRD